MMLNPSLKQFSLPSTASQLSLRLNALGWSLLVLAHRYDLLFSLSQAYEVLFSTAVQLGSAALKHGEKNDFSFSFLNPGRNTNDQILQCNIGFTKVDSKI